MTAATPTDPSSSASPASPASPPAPEPGSVRILRYTGLVEGVSYLLLVGIAMPLKYWANSPEMVRYVGMAHGWLFLAYVGLAINTAISMRWSVLRWLWITAASLIPIGTFITDYQLRREYCPKVD